jgi:hypothetical protein
VSWEEAIAEANVPLILRTPSFADGITIKMVNTLTPAEEEQLKQITTQARSDEVERLMRVQHQVFENGKRGRNSAVLAFNICSACSNTLRGIKKGMVSRVLSRNTTYGLICPNEKCSFYLKLIPVRKTSELTNVGYIQQLDVVIKTS